MGLGPLTSQSDSNTDEPVNQLSTGKAAHTSNVGLPAGTILSQTKPVVDNTSIVTFNFDPPIKAAAIEIRPTQAATPDADEGIVVTFGADNIGLATAFLDETNAAPREFFKLADGVIGRYFDGAFIDRVDIRGVGATPLFDVTIGGIS